MSEFVIFGLAFTAAIFLEYCLKPRQWRKWLGIVMGITGAVATFKLPFLVDEMNVGIVYLCMWVCGVTLFFDCDRFDDED